MTRSEAIATEVAALLRAKTPILWITTREEARVEAHLFEACATAGFVPRTWDCHQGIMRLDGTAESFGSSDPDEMLVTILARANKAPDEVRPQRDAWIMRDLAPWLDGPIGTQTNRKLVNLARRIPSAPKSCAQAIIILSPRSTIPPELLGHVTILDWPLPDRAEVGATLDTILSVYPDPTLNREAAIDAALGLSGNEIANCYSKSIVTLRRIDPIAVASEKKRVISKAKALQWYDPLPDGLDSVGGLDALKTWIKLRALAYTSEARFYGLPAPRGVLLVGISGCGKSLTAKAIATALNRPLLRYDLNAGKDKYVGASEANMRNDLAIIEAVGGVVWIDEIEKTTLASGAAGGAADGGVSSDMLGALLSWMQERRGDAFLVATANDVSALPPELLRKGRFDEIFFVDLPTSAERSEILSAALREHRRSAKLDFAEIVEATAGFTGAEIAALVPDAMFAAFSDGAREIETGDILAAARSVVPLSKSMSEKIAKLREWARERARPATSPEPDVAGTSATFRNLDL